MRNKKAYFNKLIEGVSEYDAKNMNKRADELIGMIKQKTATWKGRKLVKKEEVESIAILASVSGYLQGRAGIIEAISGGGGEVDYIG